MRRRMVLAAVAVVAAMALPVVSVGQTTAGHGGPPSDVYTSTYRDVCNGGDPLVRRKNLLPTPITVSARANDEFYATHDWCDEPTRSDHAPLVVLDDGSMDTVLTIRLEMQEPGMQMPNLFDVWGGLAPGVRVLSQRFIATGTGTFTEHAATYGFAPDTTGKVVINQQWVPRAP